MITRLVRLAFSKLATTVLEDIASEVAGTGEEPTDDQVGRFMGALVDTSAPIREIASAATTGDTWIILNNVVKDLLRNISEGVGAPSVAYTSGNMVRLVNLCRAMMERRSEGTDVTTKSPGIKGELKALSERLSPSGEGDQMLWDDVAAFVEDKFHGYRDKLVREYLMTQPRGESAPRSKLMSQAEAEAQMMKELFDVVRANMRRIHNGTFDEDKNDAAVFNTIIRNVIAKIQHGKVDDRWLGQGKGKMTGIDSPRVKWMRYVMPLRGTELYPGDRPDLGAVREWINGNFHRKDMKSQTPVQAQLPGGGTVTAPSFKTELTAKKLLEWQTAAKGVGSLDAQVLDEGATLGETVGVEDQPLEEREEYKTDYLNDPKNRADIRARVMEYIREAAATADVESSKLRKMFEFVLRIKLGFGSDADAKGERDRFEKAWKDNRSADGEELGVPHLPFRTEIMDVELWKRLGRPKRKSWRSDSDQSPHERYKFPWTQTVLVNKETGERLVNQNRLRSNPDGWKLSEVRHTTTEEPSPKHFVNWVPYSEGDRAKDIKDTLDAYDGDAWLELSLQPATREKMLKSLEEGHPLRGFAPNDIFKAYAKNVDGPMYRALGQVKLSPNMQDNSIFPNQTGLAQDMRLVMNKFGELVAADMDAGVKNAEWVLSYVAMKREGLVASRAPTVVKVAMQEIINAVVAATL